MRSALSEQCVELFAAGGLSVLGLDLADGGGESRPDRTADQAAGFEIDDDLLLGLGFEFVDELLVILRLDDDRDEPVAQGVGVEDVGKAGGDHRLDPEVGERPDRVLA